MKEIILCSYSYCKNVFLWLLFPIIILVLKTAQDFSQELSPPPNHHSPGSSPWCRLMVLHFLPVPSCSDELWPSNLTTWWLLDDCWRWWWHKTVFMMKDQLCGISVKRSLWADRILLLSISHLMVIRTANFWKSKNRGDARRLLNKVQIFRC